jgi:hypothetical protein
MRDGNRRLLGKTAALGSRTRIYQVHDGFDVESREQYDVIQRRVLFDDVQFVTLHRRLGALYLSLTGCSALFFATVAISIISYNALRWQPAAVFFALALPFLILFLVRLLLGQYVVTIFGRRSRAEMRFSSRLKAREIYGKVCAAVREAQRTARPPEAPAPEAPAEAPPAPPPVL